MRTIPIIVVGLFVWSVFSGASVAREGARVMVSGVSVAADSPLARGEHPRLLFIKADLPAIRARAKLPGVKADLALIRQFMKADPTRMPSVTAAIAYVISGDVKFREFARQKMLAERCGWYVQDSGLYAYDILYDELKPAERAAFEKRALAYVKMKYRVGVRLCYALGIAGQVNDPAVEKTIRQQVPGLLKNGSATPGSLDWWAGRRGGDTRSFHYVHQNTMTPWANATMTWTNASGLDAWANANWAKHMSAFYLYHLIPGFSRTVHIGVNCNPPATPGDNADGYFSFFAKRWQNGPAQWYTENIVHSVRDKKFSYRILPRYWGKLLWHDETLKAIKPAQWPETRYFDRMGYVSMRSDWGEKATMAHFQSGPFEIWDGSWGRNNADNNSFLIHSRGGTMAADTGTRWGNNSVPSKHMQQYFNQTVAHNSITVGDDDIPVKGGNAVRGGQVVPAQLEWLKRRKVKKKDMFFNPERTRHEGAGRITAYASSPEWTYAVGDASRSYSPDYVKSFTRQFLYLRPDTFVIFDRVTAAKGDLPKRWLLHTMNKPVSVGGNISALKPGYFRVQGDVLAATHQGGKLFSQTLLPKRDRRTIELIGGAKYRFEVNGTNRDMPADWYVRIGDRENFRDRNDFGEWRIEVTPAPGQKTDVFLHVLHCADKTATTMPKAQLIERNGQAGVRLTIKQKTYVVLFKATGKIGGSLQINQQPVMPLPHTVEDNHHRWQADARYRDWMSKPTMRAFIGEAEQDAYRKRMAQDNAPE